MTVCIYRLDEDQAARKHVGELLEATRGQKLKDPDYYEFEAHIMFDDAFGFNDSDDLTINQFVIQLVETINRYIAQRCVLEDGWAGGYWSAVVR